MHKSDFECCVLFVYIAIIMFSNVYDTNNVDRLIQTIEMIYQFIRVFLFEASYQHKKSPKSRKLFKMMYSMGLNYNRWVLEPLGQLIMQKDEYKHNKNWI
jgi:hypothetical protein